ncbi:hypothetical protein C7N43_24230 [Sphingobacteriales bacterium UPWRP_1]|nr:hypothetical protein BVG80_13540 [Sphingobacteriales bacterium TSM_CSM]PSJ74414.1 hypothetical protein C7N43_24230 [Sphingobacteriales bacterium UPWRP_1]
MLYFVLNVLNALQFTRFAAILQQKITSNYLPLQTYKLYWFCSILTHLFVLPKQGKTAINRLFRVKQV